MPTVLAMLDSSRDVFTLAFINKSIQSFVTREVVVRSAVFQGGNARKVIGSIMNEVEDKSIFFPSALRLLRLLNGKQCENLDECWNYNLESNKATSLARTSTRPFGLMICKECARGMSDSLPWNHFANEHGDGRVAFDWKIINRPFIDRFGERHGPVVVAKQVRQIENTYKGAEERDAALARLLGEVDGKVPDETEQLREKLVEAYDDAESKADAFFESKREIAVNKSKAVSLNGKGRRDKIFKELETLLDGYEHKSLALLCTWDDEWGTVGLTLCPSCDILRPLFDASSSATKKKIKAAADELRFVYDMLQSKHLLSQNFLLFLSNSTDPMERALFRYLNSIEMTPEKLLRKSWRCVDLVQEDKLLEVLFGADLKRSDLATVFSLAVVSSDEEDGATDLRNLAKGAWLEACRLNDEHTYSMSAPIWSNLNTLAKTRFRRVREALVEYLARPEVVEFIQDESAPENNQDQNVSRRKVVMSIYVDRWGQRYLFNRNFVALLSRHRSLFEDPSRLPSNVAEPIERMY